MRGPEMSTKLYDTQIFCSDRINSQVGGGNMPNRPTEAYDLAYLKLNLA